MTREKQIFEYLKERNIPTNSLESNSIMEGIVWPDEHPKSDMVNKQEFIEKVIEWVKNRDNVEKYLHVRTSLTDDFADALHKYLEE